MLFFGTEQFSADVLEGLLEHGFPIEAVITKPDSPSGRGQKVTPPAVKVVAQQRNITVFQPTNLSELNLQDHSHAVLASYGKIVPQSILDQLTIINVHPSLLPRYRGASPIESAILNGDTETGVSIMKLVAEMDAGPVYVQEKVALDGHEVAEDLYKALARMGVALLAEHLPAILDGKLQPHPQQGEPTYCAKISKRDGVLDFSKPAIELERQIRAFHEWPQSRTRLGGVDVIITKAHVGDGPYTIKAADGLLAIDALKPLGKKEMPIQAFLAGYGSKL